MKDKPKTGDRVLVVADGHRRHGQVGKVMPGVTRNFVWLSFGVGRRWEQFHLRNVEPAPWCTQAEEALNEITSG